MTWRRRRRRGGRCDTWRSDTWARRRSCRRRSDAWGATRGGAQEGVAWRDMLCCPQCCVRSRLRHLRVGGRRARGGAVGTPHCAVGGVAHIGCRPCEPVRNEVVGNCRPQTYDICMWPAPRRLRPEFKKEQSSPAAHPRKERSVEASGVTLQPPRVPRSCVQILRRETTLLRPGNEPDNARARVPGQWAGPGTGPYALTTLVGCN